MLEEQKIKRQIEILKEIKCDHKYLVNLSRQWLTLRCNPVFTELGSSKSAEIPDVIGWDSSGSIVIECKVSVKDFENDKKKYHRLNSELGMGRLRYYSIPSHLKDKIEVPPGFGLLIINDQGLIRKERFLDSKIWDHNIEAELYFLRNRILQIQVFGR